MLPFIAGIAAGAVAVVAVNNKKEIKEKVITSAKKVKEKACEAKDTIKEKVKNLKNKKEEVQKVESSDDK